VKSQWVNRSLKRLVGALVGPFGGAWNGIGGGTKRRMSIVESLSLGAKKQLLLVSCDGEHYLVGTGPDSVQTIVRVLSNRAESSLMRTNVCD
jgi:flagellar biogenesis protein FliO